MIRHALTRRAAFLGAFLAGAAIALPLAMPTAAPIERVDFGPTHAERLWSDVSDDYAARGGQCWDSGADRPLPTAVVATLRGSDVARLYTDDTARGRSIVAATYAESVGVANLPERIYSYRGFCAGGAR